MKRLITLWFIADVVLALMPPLYWVSSGASPTIVGVPLSMAYFLLIALFISASVVVAFLAERRAGTLN